MSLTFIKKITIKQFFYFVILGLLLTAFFLTWTAIKGEYRNFLNGGTRQQVVTVTQSQAMDKIGEKVQGISYKDYQIAMFVALYRLQYVHHLAVVMDRVPNIMPYEDGKLWWENISFVFTPRILFPDKPIFEATQKTNKYTGFRYAGIKKGASFETVD